MKKICLVAAVLLLAVPAWAVVNITCTPGTGADCNLVAVNYAVSGEPNKVSGLGLDITVDNGAKITSISELNPKYWVYPGSIVIINGEVNDVGTPIGDPVRFPGTLGGLNTSGITIEMGALYYPAGDNSPNAPPLSGMLLKFRVDKDCKDCNVVVAENTVRGGVVLTNPSVDPTVNATGCKVQCALPDCYPSGYTPYADWKTLGKPNCWCGKYWTQDPAKWKFQCDGDAAGQTYLTTGYRVYSDDLSILATNWKKKITDTFNPCADITHKGYLTTGYRVYSDDLSILATNWKKKDTQLPGNCPRTE